MEHSNLYIIHQEMKIPPKKKKRKPLGEWDRCFVQWHHTKRYGILRLSWQLERKKKLYVCMFFPRRTFPSGSWSASVTWSNFSANHWRRIKLILWEMQCLIQPTQRLDVSAKSKKKSSKANEILITTDLVSVRCCYQTFGSSIHCFLFRQGEKDHLCEL